MATEKRLIDANALAERYDKRIEWLRLDVHDKYSLGLYHGASTDKDLIAEIPTVVAFTEEQLANILEAAGNLENRNQKLEKELEWLKSCINCEIRKECPRHCGKVVHGCDHWEYGDSTVDAVEVVHGRWIKNWCNNSFIGHEYAECSICDCHMLDTNQFWNSNYCPNCGAKMDGGNGDD